jgi:hypothetical protein
MAPRQLTSQADRLIFASALRAECHVAGARFFGNVHIGLGAIAAALAAGAGATAFASNDLLAGSLGVAAAAVTALLTSLRPDERSQLHWNAANGFADLANRTYMALIYDGSPEVRGMPQDQGSADANPAETTDLEPAAPWKAAIGPEPELDVIETQTSGPVHTLDSFQREFHRLDAAAPPLPGRLTKKGRKAIKEHRTWHPPQYDEFNLWRARIAPPSEV